MSEPATDPSYVLGSSTEEIGRLERQARFFAGGTDRLLTCAGLMPGMRVLDIGCGVGDVSMLASAIVGAAGEIVGIDRQEDALRTATSRVAGLGLRNVAFRRADILDFDDAKKFDAVVGRFILLHFREPSVVVSKAKSLLRPGGVVAFAEMDIASASIAPPTPVLARCLARIVDLYERSGLDPDMGSRLYGLFKDADLAPKLLVDCRVEHGPEAPCLRYLVDTLRSMAPAMAALGMAETADLSLDDLLAWLEREVRERDPCMILPRLVGAWAVLDGR